tara:strand:+ start:1622 stop:1876 length:255 start_codon:yes stop_codon:yes gene_type:complete
MLSLNTYRAKAAKNIPSPAASIQKQINIKEFINSIILFSLKFSLTEIFSNKSQPAEINTFVTLFLYRHFLKHFKKEAHTSQDFS